MKITYHNWWLVFQYEYSIEKRNDAKESGVYYNSETGNFEALYVDDKVKLVTLVPKHKMSNRNAVELCDQLKFYYGCAGKTFDVKQFSHFAEKLNKAK